jgi:hypothetical protein
MSLQDFINTLPEDQKDTARTLSRKMSKIVAESWLPAGKEIREAILSDNSDKIKKVFEDRGCDFSFYEGHKVEVDFNNFEGNLKDRKETILIAYPPRPSDFNLSDRDLQDWIDEKDPNISKPPHPYIPVTF